MARQARADPARAVKNLTIKIKDYGAGVNPTNVRWGVKIFSGETVQNTPGSGLGLYLARQFMPSMGGSIGCYNEEGFTVELGIKVV